MSPTLQRAALLAVALWWGGLTFYAAVVVPIGSDVFGTVEQGFVTQRVTHWLNAAAAVALGVSALPVFASRDRRQIGAWSVLVLALVALVALHLRLDRLLDHAHFLVLDPDGFYFLHRLYLWLTAAQWLAGLVLLWTLGRARTEPV